MEETKCPECRRYREIGRVFAERARSFQTREDYVKGIAEIMVSYPHDLRYPIVMNNISPNGFLGHPYFGWYHLVLEKFDGVTSFRAGGVQDIPAVRIRQSDGTLGIVRFYEEWPRKELEILLAVISQSDADEVVDKLVKDLSSYKCRGGL